MQINRFKHLLEEYEAVDRLIEKRGPTKETARRLLVLTAAVGYHSLVLKESVTDEERETLLKLLVVNRKSMEFTEERLFKEYNKEIKKEQDKLKNKKNRFLDLYMDIRDISKLDQSKTSTAESEAKTLQSLVGFRKIFLDRLKQFPKEVCTGEELRVIGEIKEILIKMRDFKIRELRSKNLNLKGEPNDKNISGSRPTKTTRRSK